MRKVIDSIFWPICHILVCWSAISRWKYILRDFEMTFAAPKIFLATSNCLWMGVMIFDSGPSEDLGLAPLALKGGETNWDRKCSAAFCSTGASCCRVFLAKCNQGAAGGGFLAQIVQDFLPKLSKDQFSGTPVPPNGISVGIVNLLATFNTSWCYYQGIVSWQVEIMGRPFWKFQIKRMYDKGLAGAIAIATIVILVIFAIVAFLKRKTICYRCTNHYQSELILTLIYYHQPWPLFREICFVLHSFDIYYLFLLNVLSKKILRVFRN